MAGNADRSPEMQLTWRDVTRARHRLGGLCAVVVKVDSFSTAKEVFKPFKHV